VDVSEYHESVILASWLRARGLVFSHIPNSTYTPSHAAKAKNKAMGVSKGVPDYLILLPGRVVFVELKRRHGGRVSPEQLEWGEALVKSGASFSVCYGAMEAIAFIQELSSL
jgi:hypothetical protein